MRPEVRSRVPVLGKKLHVSKGKLLAVFHSNPLMSIAIQSPSPCNPVSYSGHPHDHLPVGIGGNAWICRSQLTEDVQDSVATVVVENSPNALARSPSPV